MAPKPSVSKERIPQILHAALQVFSRMGLGNARMEDIAQQAGLSKGTLYLYFESKDAVIQGIMEDFIARELSQSQSLIETTGTISEKLDHFAEMMVADVQQMQPFMSLYFEFIARTLRNQTEHAKLLLPYIDQFLSLLEALIEQGIQTRELRSVNVQEAAIAVAALFEGTLLLWLYAPDLVDPENHLKSGIELLFSGLKT